MKNGESPSLTPGDGREAVGDIDFEKLLNGGWLQAVADSAPVAIMAIDTEGLMTFWNRAAEEIFGWRAEEVLGRPNPIVPAAKGPEFQASLEETISSRPLRGAKLERRRKDGSKVWIRLSNIRLRDAAGAPVGVLAIIEDVSHERNLADRISQLLATTLDGYILADTAGRILEVNPAYCRMVGYSTEELVGTTILEREAALDAGALEELIPAMVAAGSARFETRHRRKDGAEVDLDVSITILDVPDGPLVAAFVRDITAERRLRRELEASRANLQLIYDTAGDMLFQLAVEGDDRYRFVSVNRKFLEATGLTEDQVVGKLTPEVIPEPSHSLVLRKYAEAIRNRSTVTWDEETPYPSGPKVGSVTVAPAFDAEGRCTHLIGSVHDITERVEAERAVRESQRRLATLMADLPGMVYRCADDEQWTMEFVSDGCRQLTGYEPGQLVGNRELAYVDLIHPEDRPAVWDEVQAALARRRPYVLNYRIVPAAGDVRWVWERGRGVFDDGGEILYLEGFITDITERVAAERSLAEAGRQWQATFDAMVDPVFLLDREQRVLRANRAAGELLLQPAGKLVGEHCYELVHGTDCPIERCPVVLTFASGKSERLEIELRDRWFVISADPLRDATGAVTGAVHTFRDITDRKQAEEKLKESEETYRNLFHNAQVGLFRTRIEDGKILESNDQLANMFGYENRNEIIDEYITSDNYADPGTREKMLEIVTEKGKINNCEARFYRKDRSIFWSNYSAKVYPEKGWIEGVAEDITDRKQAEEALRQLNEQLEARVVDRTSELRRAVDLMAGREIRMAELKETVRTLRRQLEEAGLAPVADDPLLEREE